MKKIFMFILLMTYSLCTTVYANSSWHWISKTRPFDVLPIAIMVTLIVECVGIIKFAKTNRGRSVFVILLGNLASFLAPYLLALNSWYGFENTINHTPFYSIGIGYLVITLLVEFPIVFFGLQKNVVSKKRLIFTIIFTNVITTVFTCILERTLCQGAW